MQLLKSVFIGSFASQLLVLTASSPGPTTPIIDPGTTFTCFDAKKGFNIGWCATLHDVGEGNDISKIYSYSVTKANQVGAKAHYNYNCNGKNDQSKKCCRADWKQKKDEYGYVIITGDDCQDKPAVKKS
ncbi:hypothetical protein PGT21_030640 [Puccinia graminis f. sp. tritici]|uniref:Uncharacterized protein n=1 Tax=Puccinia graminis f. sp. tritici TaxID=56615 RepID=A0A5B0MFI8_PUCGR|nr:hypothetical protein PGTUg99_030329 [Puccinia graminis f. sp. tritici]KAA1091299.1 hypothetical protein PGT21_030640 [Puccinia graminis f. sp. tritici]